MRRSLTIGLVVLAAACSGKQDTPAAKEVTEQSDETMTAKHEHQHDQHHHAGDGDGAHHHHRFDDPERYVERWNDPSRDEWQKPDEVLGLMQIEEGMTVADVGTGTGYFVGPLSRAVGPEGKVYALDIEQAMVDFVAEAVKTEGLTNVAPQKSPMDGPGVTGVDRFVIVNVWHHIQNREDYAKKLAEAATEGGRVVIVDFDPDGDEGWGPPKSMRLASETIASELAAGGFETEVVEETLPRQYVVVGVKR